MKILFVVSRLNNEGPINQMISLIKNLDLKKYNVGIITIFPENKESRKSEVEKMGIIIDSLNVSHKWEMVKMLYRLREKIKQYRPDILHAEGLPADIIVSLQRGTFICTTMHCNIYTDYYYRWGKNWLYKFATRQIIKLHENSLKRMNAIICCSYFLGDVYTNKIKKPIYVIQNGVETMNYTILDEIEKRKLKSDLGLSVDKRIIISVGSIDERKDPLCIVKAANNIVKKNEVQFVFCGCGSLEEECKKESNSDDILFLGKVNNVQQYLCISDIFVSASKSEGLPLSVLEAGNVGLQMVLSDIPQHKEIELHREEKEILFFSDGDSEDLAKKIQIILDNSRCDMEKMKEYFNKHFSAQNMGQRYCELYKKFV